jgi:hypothetical protein
MICPVWNAEYRPGFHRCADCDLELVGIVRGAELVASFNVASVETWLWQKCCEGDGFGHGFVAGEGGVEVVAGVEGG